jgi:hypothetical protein
MAIIISPNMNLPIPVVGVEIGPQWASDINLCLGYNGSAIDGHDHSPGKGVLIKPNGMDINTNLSFQMNYATNMGAVSFFEQPASLPSTVLDSIYDVNGDLWFNNGTGTAVQITIGNSIVGTAGSISGLPSGTASASFAGGSFIWKSSTTTYANMLFGNAFFYNAAGNYVEVSAPVTIPINYELFLPNLPTAVTSFLNLDTSGNIGLWTTDGITTSIVSGQVVALSTGLTQGEHSWELNGRYAGLTYPLDNIDSIFFAPYNLTIQSVWIYNGDAGTGSATTYDLQVASPGGSFSSILSTLGSIDSTAAANIWTDSGAVVASQTGVIKPVLSTTAITAGQAIKFTLQSSMTGPATDARIRIFCTKT